MGRYSSLNVVYLKLAMHSYLSRKTKGENAMSKHSLHREVVIRIVQNLFSLSFCGFSRGVFTLSTN